ncbi:MAG: hypothetical protein SFY66_04735 [Oculatellaceae cyanobacterium bins.114]|nr:hypothetical protein [Oculatellaceae cyanobacterium bins.114]
MQNSFGWQIDHPLIYQGDVLIVILVPRSGEMGNESIGSIEIYERSRCEFSWELRVRVNLNLVE